MARLRITLISTAWFGGLCFANLSWAQTAEVRPVADPSQAYCISVMQAFPNDDTVPRYQFFKLTEKLSVGASDEFRRALAHFGETKVDAQTPIIDVVEVIANPVIRQAAPDLVIANMGHLIEFNSVCETYIQGQIESLTAFYPALNLDDPVIAEDALYLRQILSDSLMRLDATSDPVYAKAVNIYATSLITMRDNLEFQAYASEIGDIEALYMTDLDGRLARSNDMINSEIDREVLGDAITLSDDMNEQARKKASRDRVGTLLRILTRN